MSNSCPCGSQKNINDCCNAYIAGVKTAVTAETVMRSRYTAYTQKNETYLLLTWHDSTRPVSLNLEEDCSQWFKLKIVKCELGGENDIEGIVEFVARFKLDGKAHKLQETSRFKKEGGRWFYVDGEVGE